MPYWTSYGQFEKAPPEKVTMITCTSQTILQSQRYNAAPESFGRMHIGQNRTYNLASVCIHPKFFIVSTEKHLFILY